MDIAKKVFQENKRKSDKSDKTQSAKKKPKTSEQHRGSALTTNPEEDEILAEAQNIMKRVDDKLSTQRNTKLNEFLRKKISDLQKGKKEMVGVFGKTGAGKSSLINTIIGKENLLPSSNYGACTSVMIKVEANMSDSKYMAEIEFIKKQEWEDELLSLLKPKNPDNSFDEDSKDDDFDDDEDDDDDDEKISALYGEENKNKSPEELMSDKHFREIPEFLKDTKKILTCGTVSQLSKKIAKFTRSDKNLGRQYWPLVKCVTIKVPNVSHLLEHVTLVDLPGNGDRNKSRDEIWKECVGSCSTVWIVGEIHRAESQKEAWEILENTISLMGNGGECQRIFFICTKTDDIGIKRKSSNEEIRVNILDRNKQAKEDVKKDFKAQKKIGKHFSGDSEDFFKVFTVSSKEFLEGDYLQKDETEIPRLQEFLQNLNDRHSKTSNYVSGAYGILSLIQGANHGETACHKSEVYTVLEQNIKAQRDIISQSMNNAYTVFENRLSDGVQQAQESYERDMKSILRPKRKSDQGFHRVLKAFVENAGIYKPKKSKHTINMNEKLASCMRDCIDEEFKTTFPNDRTRGPFKGAISKFTLGTGRLADKYKDVSLQLIFLETEEAKLKTKLKDLIRGEKKKIYNSLTDSIKDSMKTCYEDAAAAYGGKGSLQKMRDTIMKHLNDPENKMFDKAKDDMLSRMKKLMGEILSILNEDMMKSIELSLKTDDNSIPDVTEEYGKVKIYREKLMGGANRETPMCVQPAQTSSSTSTLQ